MILLRKPLSKFPNVLARAGIMSTLAWSATLQAAVPLTALVQQPSQENCATRGFVAAAASSEIRLPAASIKSAAILGGQPSALELIRIAQEGEGAPARPETAVFVAAETAEPQALSPAVGGIRAFSNGCSNWTASPAPEAFGSEDFLASKRLAVGRTAFDRDWRRVSGDRVSARRYRRLVGHTMGGQLSTLRTVNSWVNQAIAFTDDEELFSRADFWAGAEATLRLRRGDCEDIALTKMQLLAAAGIDREDMILTIARDLVRNADHAVLIVRHDGRYYMLDNASDELFDASSAHDYRPILSFGNSQTWLHGY
jgi:predicted transglutaminase-like cysteine proteinase